MTREYAADDFAVVRERMKEIQGEAQNKDPLHDRVIRYYQKGSAGPVFKSQGHCWPAGRNITGNEPCEHCGMVYKAFSASVQAGQLVSCPVGLPES
jgi:hypothetical protein